LQETKLQDKVQKQQQLLRQLQEQHAALTTKLQAVEVALGSQECMVVGLANLSLSIGPVHIAAVGAASESGAEQGKERQSSLQQVSCKLGRSSSTSSTSSTSSSAASKSAYQQEQVQKQQLQQQRRQVGACRIQ
jgi:hypothetical protein